MTCTVPRVTLPANPKGSLNRDPHRFVMAIDVAGFQAYRPRRPAPIAAFFASDGTKVIQPPGVPAVYFETPIDLRLLKDQGIPTGGGPQLYPGRRPRQELRGMFSGSQASGPIPTDAASNRLNRRALPDVRAPDRPPTSAGHSAVPIPPLIDLALDGPDAPCLVRSRPRRR